MRMPDYLGQLRHNGELMAIAAERDLDALDTHVPSCPEWNMGKLIVHTGQHHRWVADAIRRAGEPPETPGKPGLRGRELVEWFRSGWGELADLLSSKSDDEPAWTWSEQQTVAFWRRRTALETLVHRWDAENATGQTSELDPELANDGIDEMLFVMLGEGDGTTYNGAPMNLMLTTTDVGGSWNVELSDGAVLKPQRGESEADLVVRAPAGNLLLYLWGRLGADAVWTEGSAELSESFNAWLVA